MTVAKTCQYVFRLRHFSSTFGNLFALLSMPGHCRKYRHCPSRSTGMAVTTDGKFGNSLEGRVLLRWCLPVSSGSGAYSFEKNFKIDSRPQIGGTLSYYCHKYNQQVHIYICEFTAIQTLRVSANYCDHIQGYITWHIKII